MRIQIFQHLPALPKAGIFRPLPILCVAFRAFIPDRSVFRCSLSPVFLCSVPSSRCINPHTLSRTPPLPRATLLPHPSPHLPLHSTPAYQHPPHFQHRPPDDSAKGQHTRPRRCTATAPRSRTRTPPRHHAACRFSQPHTPAKKPHPPHTQASKKDCPAQEQSFL